MSGKKFVGLVLTERQAKSLHHYLQVLRETGTGPSSARDLTLIRVKVGKALDRNCESRRGIVKSRVTTLA